MTIAALPGDDKRIDALLDRVSAAGYRTRRWIGWSCGLWATKWRSCSAIEAA